MAVVEVLAEAVPRGSSSSSGLAVGGTAVGSPVSRIAVGLPKPSASFTAGCRPVSLTPLRPRLPVGKARRAVACRTRHFRCAVPVLVLGVANAGAAHKGAGLIRFPEVAFMEAGEARGLRAGLTTASEGSALRAGAPLGTSGCPCSVVSTVRLLEVGVVHEHRFAAHATSAAHGEAPGVVREPAFGVVRSSH